MKQSKESKGICFYVILHRYDEGLFSGMETEH